MTRRENFFRAVRREDPKEVPFFFTLCDSLIETFRAKHGGDDYFGYYNMPFRTVKIKPTQHKHDFSKYFEGWADVDEITEWGLGLKHGSRYHFTAFIGGMEKLETVEEIERFPMPDILADYRWDGVSGQIEKLKKQDLIAVNHEDMAIDIFEPAWYVRGMENLLMDMMTRPEMAAACLNRMCDIKCALAEKWVRAGVDVLIFGDDVGTERAMLMNADLWREWLKPLLARAIRAAKSINPEVLCYYHSDGVITDIIEDLIEIGVDILNPIQPECMDPVEIKQKYGDRLAFWGTIGTQTTMPFAAPDEVREKCLEMIKTVGKGGGLIIAPTHVLEPEVPFENIEALADAVNGYNARES